MFKGAALTPILICRLFGWWPFLLLVRRLIPFIFLIVKASYDLIIEDFSQQERSILCSNLIFSQVIKVHTFIRLLFFSGTLLGFWILIIGITSSLSFFIWLRVLLRSVILVVLIWNFHSVSDSCDALGHLLYFHLDNLLLYVFSFFVYLFVKNVYWLRFLVVYYVTL